MSPRMALERRSLDLPYPLDGHVPIRSAPARPRDRDPWRPPRSGARLPTANVRLGEDAGDVAFGVYAGRVDGRAAAISVGVRPSFGEWLEPLLEAHILDFSGALYGSEVVVELVQLLRPELAFESVDELVEQIHADVAAVRAALASEPRRPPRRGSAAYLPHSLDHCAL
jgi:Riboflavin kinase